MAHRIAPLTALLLFSTSAFAQDELAAKAAEIARNSSLANKGTQHGEVLKGSGKQAEWTVELAAGRQVEWRVELEAGTCYWFGAETTGKALAEYLFDPGDHKIAQVEPDQPEGMLTFCATVNGSHKLIARTAPPSDVRVAVFGKSGAHEQVAQAKSPSLAPSLPRSKGSKCTLTQRPRRKLSHG